MTLLGFLCFLILCFVRSSIILGDEAIQLASAIVFKATVWAHIPYPNIAEIRHEKIKDNKWRLVIELIDHNETSTFVLKNELMDDDAGASSQVYKLGEVVFVDDEYAADLQTVMVMIKDRCPKLIRKS